MARSFSGRREGLLQAAFHQQHVTFLAFKGISPPLFHTHMVFSL